VVLSKSQNILLKNRKKKYWMIKQKKPESTQLNFNNPRPEILDRDNLTNKKNQNKSRSLRPNKLISNDKN